ncbi:MAG: TolC family protein, partial [Alphaproteobacteria bacterium]|nr:TolC family protein [Alphaproteobacteria bacterium]
GRVFPPGAPAATLDDATLSYWPILPAYPGDPQLDAMIERTPAVQIAQNDVRKQREKLQVAESQMLPRLYAEAHARRTSPGLENTLGDSDNFVGMRFAMPLFDNFVRSARAQSEQAAIGAAESRLIAVREKMRRDLRLLTGELARLGNLQAAQFETVRAAAIRLKNAKFRFEELGSKEQKELMLANLDYLRTFERSDDTIRQYFTVYNKLLRALGAAGADWSEG